MLRSPVTVSPGVMNSISVFKWSTRTPLAGLLTQAAHCINISISHTNRCSAGGIRNQQVVGSIPTAGSIEESNSYGRSFKSWNGFGNGSWNGSAAQIPAPSTRLRDALEREMEALEAILAELRDPAQAEHLGF